MNVRPATVADARAIAIAHVRAWQAAYRGVMPDAFLDAMDVDQRAEGWVRALTTPPDGMTNLVVEDSDGHVVGMATYGPARGSIDEREGELWAINLDPSAWGEGMGRALLDAATAGLAAGYDHAMLWVVVENDRARRFYERAGWHDSGLVKVDDSFGPSVTEARYERDLPA